MEPDNNQNLTHSHKSSSFSRLSIFLIVVVVVLAGLLIGVLIYKDNESHGSTTASLPPKIAPAEVSITNSGFVPSTIRVTVGQAVVWTNNDSKPHVVASDPYPTDNILPGLNSKQYIPKSGTYSYIFNTVGTFTYHDNLYPITYKGTVVVSQNN